jgi:hypothetical protein
MGCLHSGCHLTTACQLIVCLFTIYRPPSPKMSHPPKTSLHHSFIIFWPSSSFLHCPSFACYPHEQVLATHSFFLLFLPSPIAVFFCPPPPLPLPISLHDSFIFFFALYRPSVAHHPGERVSTHRSFFCPPPPFLCPPPLQMSFVRLALPPFATPGKGVKDRNGEEVASWSGVAGEGG